MTLLRDLRARARHILPPVAAVCLMGYFAYHSIQGERGYLSFIRLETDLAQAHLSEAKLRAERDRLERNVTLLQLDGMDLDLLEERARDVLNYGMEDDYMILIPNASPQN